MEAKETERIEELRDTLGKWFDRGREWGNFPIAKDMLAELEADGEAQAEISFKAGTRVIIDLLYRWCNAPFQHCDFIKELNDMGIDWSK